MGLALDGYNVVPQEQPPGADWQGGQFVQEAGATYEHTFTVSGQYVYASEPIDELDMVGRVTVAT